MVFAFPIISLCVYSLPWIEAPKPGTEDPSYWSVLFVRSGFHLSVHVTETAWISLD